IPLLVFQLTHSAVNLAITTATWALPHLLFGLFIGAWVDRVDRKRLMIAVDVLLALTLLVIPGLALAGRLNVIAIYAVDFVASSLSMVFQQAEFTAIPSLVGQRDLVTANGRITASYQTMQMAGPTLAGAIATVVSVPALLLFDSVSYVASAATLLWVGVRFNRKEETPRPATTIRADIVEGLRYVVAHPVLRNISLMMMLFNLVDSTFQAQQVLYAKERLHTNNFELGLLFAMGGVGAVLFSLAAGFLRRRFAFSTVVIGCLALTGLLTVAYASVPWFGVALVFLLFRDGVASLLNINTFSLRQAIVPNQMLGRVLSVAGLLAFSATPIGSLAGGYLIQQTHNVSLVFQGIGVLLFVIPIAFSLTALGRADRYLPPEAKARRTSARSAD
ncbi:MAG TPA: MFS transporter, partial [Candidatus Dormibacteraeota bacterium]|nr:MFS transporter [Candidatus Dormibacteraeota bacterium]